MRDITYQNSAGEDNQELEKKSSIVFISQYVVCITYI